MPQRPDSSYLSSSQGWEPPKKKRSRRLNWAIGILLVIAIAAIAYAAVFAMQEPKANPPIEERGVWKMKVDANWKVCEQPGEERC